MGCRCLRACSVFAAITAASLSAIPCALASTSAPPPQVTAGGSVPAAAVAEMQSIFSEDAQAQLHAGTTAPAPNQYDSFATTTGARSINALLTMDADAAAYTELQGGPVWDSSRTTLSNTEVTWSLGSIVDVRVDVTNLFHIAGMPDGAFSSTPMSFSGEENPYSLMLSDADGTWRAVSVRQTPTPGQPAPTGGSNAMEQGAAALKQWASSGAPTFQPAVIAAPNGYIGNYATAYAQYWWNGFNPAYPQYSDDCMNFASQVIHAGGVQTGSVWYPGSLTWINVQQFYLEEREWTSPDGYELHYAGSDNSLTQPGYLTAWDWGGQTLSGSLYMQHEMYVDAKSGNTLLLAAHTNPRWNYPSSSVFAQYNSNTFYMAQAPN